MNAGDRHLLYAALRSDFPSFIQRSFQTVAPGAQYQHNWHIDAIAHALEEVAAGRTHRLVITMPPRSLKSISASVAFPAWLLGRNPRAKVLAVSYAEALAEKLALDCQKIIEAPWYRDIFPMARIDKRKSARSDFETTLGGGRYSTSVAAFQLPVASATDIPDAEALNPVMVEDESPLSSYSTVIEPLDNRLIPL